MINKNNIVSVTKQYDDNSVFYSYRVVFNTNQVCFVPLDEANTDYQEIQEWIADGGTVIDNGGSE
jgi:hypothetical protein